MDKLGSYELNQIYTGNASELLVVLPEACIDLTVTSPPYDKLRDYEGYIFDFEPIATELFRVTKQGGVIVWIVGDATVSESETGTSFRQALGFMELGFNLHDTMIYQKNNPPPQFLSKRYTNAFEYMFVFAKGKISICNYLRENCKHVGAIQSGIRTTASGRQSAHRNRSPRVVKKEKIKTNIWGYNVGIGQSATDKIAYQHPAIFPEALARDHILSWSNPGDTVLDPLCGSGTTLKMAKQLGRKWLGFDIAEEYVELAMRRVGQANPPLFTL